jgi:ABC-type transport system involved in multi-copper enzyme maturation permease subunit
MSTLLGIELFKLRKRKISWILLAALIGMFCLVFFSHYYLVESSETSYEVLAAPLQFPDAFNLIFSTAQGVGTLVLVILASFVLGEEYSQGTVRQMVARIRTRPQYLGAKALSLLIMALIATVISLIVGVIIASITTAKLGELSLDFITLSLFGDIGRMFGGTALTLTVNALLAMLFVVLAKSAWAGIGAYIGYGLVEGVFTTISASMEGGWLKSVSSYLITPNTYAFVHLEEGGFSLWFPQLYPGVLHATVVLFCWCAFFLGISFYLFQRRDITA